MLTNWILDQARNGMDCGVEILSRRAGTPQNDKEIMGKLEEKSCSVKCPAGSALILVIVITVLLATVGVMFVMVSRVGQSATSAIADNRELSAAADVVFNRIQTILVDDLFGVSLAPTADLHLLAPPAVAGRRPNYSGFDILNEPWDAPLSNWPIIRFGLGDDPWLASLEPELDSDGGTPFDPSDDRYFWPHISDLYEDFPIFGIPPSLRAVVAEPNVADDFAPADADGDGVIDSRWVRLPVTSSKGKAIFAAVRIIDNCGMLNLNTVHTADPDSKGKYLSAVDYERFLRGSDANPSIPPDKNNIRRARKADGTYDPCDPSDSYQRYHDVVMNIENPGPEYVLFDIGDELEIRNRYLLTSPVEARFERHDVANYTLDAGGGIYGALKIPRTIEDFDRWMVRMDHRNFEGDPIHPSPEHPEPYKYDRRHVCTFYSFDRNLRRRMYPFVDVINDVVDPNRIDWLLEGSPVFTPGLGVPVNVRNIKMAYDTNPAIELEQRKRSRRHILYLLYALRAYFLDINPDAGYKAAAKRSAQVVANIVDYIDDDNPASDKKGPFFDVGFGSQKNDKPTYINREIVRQLILEVSGGFVNIGNPAPAPLNSYEFGLGVDDADETVYGYERQPFISEVYCDYDQVAGMQAFAVELCSPYDSQLDLAGWRIQLGADNYILPSGAEILPVAPTSPGGLERLVVVTEGHSSLALGPFVEIFGFGLSLLSQDVIKLQRPDPANPGQFITVDHTQPQQTDLLTGTGIYVSKRADTAWRFADASHYMNDSISTLGAANNVPPAGVKGYQMPVRNKNEQLTTLHDFEMVLFIGNEKTELNEDPNTVTTKIARAADEGDIRYDIENRPELLEYICFMNRPQRNLPGRININTATMEVIRAAIPPHPAWNPDADALANSIIASRQLPPIGNGPFERISDLLDVQGFTQMMSDPNSGDPIIGDFEDRDWILSRVANIFTVRSDVFTAYIIVRIDHDGPQKRMIAIFDRSNVFSPADKPRLVALHPVPDPR